MIDRRGVVLLPRLLLYRDAAGAPASNAGGDAREAAVQRNVEARIIRRGARTRDRLGRALGRTPGCTRELDARIDFPDGAVGSAAFAR